MDDAFTPTAESLYNSLAVYRFSQSYVAGKSVAVVGRRSDRLGTALLAETAESVTCLVSGATVEDSPAPNVNHQKVTLPNLPYPEGYFDVVVALQTIETLKRPEDLILEMKRVMSKEGILILSTPDKQTHSNDRNFRDPYSKRELYAPEIGELLEKNFERVKLYRQSCVGGGLILDLEAELSEVTVRAVRFSVPGSPADTEPPPTHYILAVCGNEDLPEAETYARLLLDKDHLVQEESEELREDVELLKEEVSRMQETEVQAFRAALQIERQRVAQISRELKRTRNHLEEIQSSQAWRWFLRYRRLKARLTGFGRG